MGYFYLSFCDVTKPAGQHFLGATVVRAKNERGAVAKATELGINPGGEIAITQLKELPSEGAHFLNTFVPRETVIAEGAQTLAELGDDYGAIGTVCQDCNPVTRQ